MPRRIALTTAYVDCYPDDTGTIDIDNSEDITFVLAAAIAMCWRGPDLKIGSWRRDFRRDVVDYGEVALDRLMVLLEIPLEAFIAEGQRLFLLCNKSIPSAREVNEAREDFSEGPPENSGEGALVPTNGGFPAPAPPPA